MATPSKKGGAAAGTAATSTKSKVAHKIGNVGALILAAVSKAAGAVTRNDFEGVTGLTPMKVIKGETVQKGVKNSASAHKNEGNKIKNKLVFDEKTGEAKAAISKLLAGDESNADFVEFRKLAKAAWADLEGNKYSPAVKALAAKAVAYGGQGGGGSRMGKALPAGGADML